MAFRPRLSNGLTRRQHEILQLMLDYYAANCRAPAYADVMVMSGLRSAQSVALHVRSLEKAGYIAVIAGRQRGITFTPKALAGRCCPMCGQFAKVPEDPV